MPGGLRKDPTRTGLIVRAFGAQINRRMSTLKHEITNLVVTEDAFGHTLPTVPHIRNVEQRFRFMSDVDKADAFFQWLQDQIDAGVLEIDSTGGNWTDTYVTSAYKKGVLRAYTDAHPEAEAAPTSFYVGGRHAFLTAAFGAPESLQRLALLHMRTFEGLRGITAVMSQRIAAILTAGLANGTHPNKLARQLNAEVDGVGRYRGLLLARTELIHAHAEGQLDAFEELGIDELGLFAEWSTADDDRVCPRCAAMAGRLYTVAAARGLIPLHPLCRCCWVPSYLRQPLRRGRVIENRGRGEWAVVNRGLRGRTSRFANRGLLCIGGT